MNPLEPYQNRPMESFFEEFVEDSRFEGILSNFLCPKVIFNNHIPRDFPKQIPFNLILSTIVFARDAFVVEHQIR